VNGALTNATYGNGVLGFIDPEGEQRQWLQCGVPIKSDRADPR